MKTEPLVTVPLAMEQTNRIEIEQLLVNASEAARLIDVSPKTWSRYDASGTVPRAIELGLNRWTKRWSLCELRDWVAANCPCRQDWEQLDG